MHRIINEKKDEEILGSYFLSFKNSTIIFPLGAVHKLRLQEEGVGGRLFVNFYTIENVNGGGRWSKKAKSCKLSL